MDAYIVTCLFCGDEIGEYDPLVVVEHDGERETSLASEAELRDRAAVLVIHARCAARFHSELGDEAEQTLALSPVQTDHRPACRISNRFTILAFQAGSSRRGRSCPGRS
jgi:hypothetical protein